MFLFLGYIFNIEKSNFTYAEEGAETMENKKPPREKIKEMLSPLQYKVTQEDGTEAPFSNEYWDNKKEGIYVDVVTGEALFSSKDKYDSGTGWPSFTKPLKQEVVTTKTDNKMFMARTEVRSKIGDSHLGHLFNDGPKEAGGNRYCMNSSSLKFIPVNELEEKGYGEFLNLFKDSNNSTSSAEVKPQEIVLAGGCFWGMEELLRTQKGVIDVEVGYAGGDSAAATYDQVKTGRTGNAESVKIKYDPSQLSLEDLLKYFFKIHDPTTLNRQGNDTGTQYRSAIFTTTKEQLEVAKSVKDIVQKSGAWKKDLTTEILPLNGFIRAEGYHQDYLQKNPGGYTCHFLRDVEF